MAEALAAAALFILVVTGLGFFRVVRSRVAAEKLMAVQLLGTGGAAILLLIGAATDAPATTDVALLLMLFSAFSSVAFALGQPGTADASKPDEGEA